MCIEHACGRCKCVTRICDSTDRRGHMLATTLGEGWMVLDTDENCYEHVSFRTAPTRCAMIAYRNGGMGPNTANN